GPFEPARGLVLPDRCASVIEPGLVRMLGERVRTERIGGVPLQAGAFRDPVQAVAEHAVEDLLGPRVAIAGQASQPGQATGCSDRAGLVDPIVLTPPRRRLTQMHTRAPTEPVLRAAVPRRLHLLRRHVPNTSST